MGEWPRSDDAAGGALRWGSKADARRALRRERDAAPVGARAACDAVICERVLQTAAFRAADAVLTYVAIGSEVETRGVIAAALAAGKAVALPRCEPGERGRMTWHRVGGLDGLVPGAHGILEPAGDPGTVARADAFAAPLALVPGLAFDRAGFRLGYGGGYYDRFLAGFGGVSIGLVRSSQLFDDLRGLGLVERHDRAVDAVATENGVLRCRGDREGWGH